MKATTIQKCGFQLGQEIEESDLATQSNSQDGHLNLAEEIYGCSFNSLYEIDKSLAVCDTETIDWDQNATKLIESLAPEPEQEDGL